MRLLANENVPRRCVESLRGLGFDVAWIREDAPGSTDAAVIARATAEGRALVTLDKDFGELAFRSGARPPEGILLIRVTPPLPDRVTAVALAALQGGRSLAGLFVVADETRVRERPLP